MTSAFPRLEVLPFLTLGSFLALALVMAFCVCQRFKRKEGSKESGPLGERLSNHLVNCEVPGGTAIPVYGPTGVAFESVPRRRDEVRSFLNLGGRRKSRNSTIDRALPEIPGASRGAEVVDTDPNYDLILKPESDRSGTPAALPPSRDPIYSSVRGEDSSISEGMYAKVQEPRNGPTVSLNASGSARPGVMALEVNGRVAGQPPLGIREHEYSRIRNLDEENLYFKVGSDSGSESGYAHVHARESSLRRGKACGDDGRGEGSRMTDVVVAGDDMYAEIRKTSNPDSDTVGADPNAHSLGVFDATTSENLYAFPPPVPEKQYDLNDSFDPEFLQPVQSIPFIDEAGFTSPTSPDLPPRNSVPGGVFSFATGGATTPPVTLFSQTTSLSSISHNKTPSLASAASSNSTIVNASAIPVCGDDHVGNHSFAAASAVSASENPLLSPIPFNVAGESPLLTGPHTSHQGPDDKKDYVIITARESVPVLQARRAQEAAAKELAEKKRRHVYQNVNGGIGGCETGDDSDSDNYAKVMDPDSFSKSLEARKMAPSPQRSSVPTPKNALPRIVVDATPPSAGEPTTVPFPSDDPDVVKTRDGWLRREHTYSTVEGEEQLYSEVPDPPSSHRDQPIDPPPPELFDELLNDRIKTTSSSGESWTRSSRNKLEDALSELHAEPPYTTILDPPPPPLPSASQPQIEPASRLSDEKESLKETSEVIMEEPPYTQIPAANASVSVAAVSSAPPTDQSGLNQGEQLVSPGGQDVLPPSADESLEGEPPYTKIVTVGPPSTSVLDGRSAVDSARTLRDSAVAPRTGNAVGEHASVIYLLSSSSNPQPPSSTNRRPASASHVTTIEITGDNHLIHGNM